MLSDIVRIGFFSESFSFNVFFLCFFLWWVMGITLLNFVCHRVVAVPDVSLLCVWWSVYVCIGSQ